VLIRVTSAPGKYATLSGKGDLLVVPKAQATEFPANEAPRRQKELERRGFKTKVNQYKAPLYTQFSARKSPLARAPMRPVLGAVPGIKFGARSDGGKRPEHRVTILSRDESRA
jgi:hypothetical protein